MLDPNCQVMTTSAVIAGKPILAISYTQEYHGASFDPSQPGTFSGFALFDESFNSGSTLNFYDFKDVQHCVDAHVLKVLLNAVPGWYERESESEPFIWEPLEL